MQAQHCFEQASRLWTKPQIANLISSMTTRHVVLLGFLAP